MDEQHGIRGNWNRILWRLIPGHKKSTPTTIAPKKGLQKRDHGGSQISRRKHGPSRSNSIRWCHLVMTVVFSSTYINYLVLLMVEISTQKPKSINFAKFKRKRTPERLFPFQNAYCCNSRTLLNGFGRFLNSFWMLCSTPERPKCLPNGKNHSAVFFPHQPPKSIFFGFGVKESSIGKLQVGMKYTINPTEILASTTKLAKLGHHLVYSYKGGNPLTFRGNGSSPGTR